MASTSAPPVAPGPAPERGQVLPLRPLGCPSSCAFRDATLWHHDRLLAIEEDPEVLLDLMELAVTWSELDYSETPVISPPDWMAFVARHHWTDRARVERAFRVAIDVVRAGARASRPQRTLWY